MKISNIRTYGQLMIVLIAFVVVVWEQLSLHIETANTLELIKLSIGFSLFVTISVVGMVAAVRGWYRKGRDWYWRKPQVLDAQQQAELRKIQPKEAAVREFLPPENLSPALMGLLLNDDFEFREVVATIIDLSRRGFVRIVEGQSVGLFIKEREYFFQRTPKSLEGLQDFEKLALEKLFAHQSQVSVRHVPRLLEMTKLVNEEAVARGFYFERPDLVRRKHSRISGIILILAIIGLYFANQALVAFIIHLPILGGVVVGVVMAALAKRFLAGAMPQKTALGFDMLRRIHGYQQFVSQASLHRHRLLDNPSLLETVLPYGIIFKSENELRKTAQTLLDHPIDWFVSERTIGLADRVEGIYAAATASIRRRNA